MNKNLFFLIYMCFYSFTLFAQLPQKIVICGVCKNVEEKLPYSKKIVEAIGELFTDYRVIVYENNSSDHTVDSLNNWARLNAKVSIQSEFLSQEYLENYVINRTIEGALFRPELIARARNIVMEKALSKQYDDFPYIIWMDMDFSFFPDLDGLIEIFTTDREWDAVFAYGIAAGSGAYWDWYAMRYEKYPFGPELLGKTWYEGGAIMEKSFSLNKNDDWFPVYSAFGGCGVYKKESIQGCRYSGLVTEDTEKLMRGLIDDGIRFPHAQSILYQEKIKKLEGQVILGRNSTYYSKIKNPEIGIILHNFDRPVIWKMDSQTFEYPSICEHVPFHASMIVNGHNKLFINPRFVFRY